MSFNARLAEAFARSARILDLLGEDAFRVNAIARAARTFEDHPGDLAGLSREQLVKIQGVGPKIADKVIEFGATGKVAEFEEIASRVPAGVIALMDLPGLGPKTVGVLWQQGGVNSAADLSKIIEDGSILKLPRMGSKTVEKIKQSLAFGQTVGQRQNIGIALPLAERIVREMRGLPGVKRCEFAGSLRRGKETVGDIDILVETEGDPGPIAESFRARSEVTRVLAGGERKSSVMMSLVGGSARWGAGGGGGSEAGGAEIQIDLRVVPTGRFGAAWMYFTGSKEHNVRVREIAQKKGLTLNEYGLFKKPADDEKPEWAEIVPIAAETENEVFAALGLAWVPPELREDAGEVVATPARLTGGLFDAPSESVKAPAAEAATGPLVQVSDMKAELHAHTTASDGRLSIDELAAEAVRRGFHTLAITDHSRSSAQANGLQIDRLLAHVDAIHAARERFPSLRLLAGSEVDILADGTLDYPDEILARLDWVVASPHTALSQDEGSSTERLLKAIRHPLVHVLGHPTGRLVNRRPGLSPRMAELFAAAAKHGVAMEINSHWMRLDLRDVHVREALATGCLISVNCDTHELEDLDNLRYGVLTGRRGGLVPDRCINCWSVDRLEAWRRLKRK